MTKGPKTVAATAPIEEALSIMRDGGFRRIPVVSPKGKLVGLVSLDDVLLFLATEFSWIGELLGKKVPRRGAGATTTVNGGRQRLAGTGTRSADR
jgi:predicted transcriptional regulator